MYIIIIKFLVGGIHTKQDAITVMGIMGGWIIHVFFAYNFEKSILWFI